MPDDGADQGRHDFGLDTTVSHSARIWNYWLGGKDNYAVDREAGDRVAAMLPSIVAQARADRAFLGRAIRYLAGEAGIRQFLDIGTGLPTANNTHEVAQRVAPESRIVYADNDPLVLAHAAGRLAPHPRHRPGVLDRQEADGGGATGQLPGRQPLDERRPRRGLEPGVLSCSRWRPELTSSSGQPAEEDEFCGVARKP